MHTTAMMRRFSFALVSVIVISSITTSSIAQNSTTNFPYLARVTQGEAAVRAGADSRYYLFGQLFQDDFVQVVAHKSGWARIRTYGPTFKDFYGYVKLPKSETRRFKVNSDAKTGLTNGSVDIFGPNLDDKAEPARSWKPIARLTKPTKLKILGAESTDSLLIFKVELPRESEGWINLTKLRHATIAEITIWENFVAQANNPKTIATETTQQPIAKALNRTSAATVDKSDTTEVVQKTTETVKNVIPDELVQKPVNSLTMGKTIDINNNSKRNETPTRNSNSSPLISNGINNIVKAIAETDDQINRQTINNNSEKPNQVLGTNLGPIKPAGINSGAITQPPTDYTNLQTAQVENNSSNPSAQVEEEPEEKPRVYISKADVRGLSLEDLELMYSRLLREPKHTAEVDPLQQMYSIYADEFAKEGVEKSHARSRAAQLEIWAELQIKMANIQKMRTRVKAGSLEADAATLSLENSGNYQAIGILVSSTIYDGKRLPKLYRLRDQSTGRTIGYLAPSDDFDLVNMIGEVLGIKGDRSYDGGLRLNVFTPDKIDILTKSQ